MWKATTAFATTNSVPWIIWFNQLLVPVGLQTLNSVKGKVGQHLQLGRGRGICRCHFTAACWAHDIVLNWIRPDVQIAQEPLCRSNASKALHEIVAMPFGSQWYSTNNIVLYKAKYSLDTQISLPTATSSKKNIACLIQSNANAFISTRADNCTVQRTYSAGKVFV